MNTTEKSACQKVTHNKMEHALERDILIFGYPIDWSTHKSSIERFSGIHYSTLKKLVELGYVEADDSYNNSPSIQEILDLMETYPSIKAHGYVTAPDREDNRITIEGIKSDLGIMNMETLTDHQQMCDMLQLCKHADELEFLETFFAWWD